MGDEADALDLAALGKTLRKHAEGTPEREAYLENLRELVQSGEYRVDSQALARKLIESARLEGAPGDEDHSADPAK